MWKEITVPGFSLVDVLSQFYASASNFNRGSKANVVSVCVGGCECASVWVCVCVKRNNTKEEKEIEKIAKTTHWVKL